MSGSSRDDRLLEDLESLRALKRQSTILDFDSTGEPPDRYTLIFRGAGISRESSAQAQVEFLDLHRCALRLPYSYPERPPDVRWLTPIFHPNISFSGFLNLKDIGLPWDNSIGLDLVCERLWDVARMAYVELQLTTNYSAKSWFESPHGLRLPVDARPLRDRGPQNNSNVVRYERRGRGTVVLPNARSGRELFYIGEDTPLPPVVPRRMPDRHASNTDDDDVIYIGDE